MAGRDQDGVAVDRRVDRGLDGGVAAAADQQEAVAVASVTFSTPVRVSVPCPSDATTCQPGWLPPATGSVSTTAVMLAEVSVPV